MDEAVYNIGVVSRMTEIPENTLRAWERRYDFPQASRTDGGHRLYTKKEIMRIQWVKERLDEGMQISQAVRSLQHLAGNEAFPENPAESVPRPAGLSTTGNYAQRIYESLVSLDAGRADAALAEAMAVYSIETIIYDIISPVLIQIGDAWFRREINVATEHFASQHLRHHLLMWMRTGAAPYTNARPVILACAPGEFHEGGLLMFGTLLRRLRWSVRYLGQAVPLPDLIEFINEARPSAVIIVATLDENGHHLEPLADSARTSENPPLLAFGGQAFSHNPGYPEQLNGIFLGHTLQEGLEKLDHLLRQKFPFLN